MERPPNVEAVAIAGTEHGVTPWEREAARYILWLEDRYELLDTMARCKATWWYGSTGDHDSEFGDAVIDALRFLDGVKEEPDGYVQVGWVCPRCDRFGRCLHHAVGHRAVCTCVAYQPMEPVYVDRRLA